MNEHYYTEKPTSKANIRLVTGIHRNIPFRFFTGSGVFSTRRVDYATSLLIENMAVPKEGKVLDMGCGYGPIGITAAKISPNSEVVMVDLNERACELAEENVKANEVSNACVIKSDMFSAVSGKYNTILMNPPIALGMKKLEAMISESKEYLEPGGSLQLVARHSKGGKRLEKHMEKVFGNVRQVAKGGGFRVYVSSKH